VVPLVEKNQSLPNGIKLMWLLFKGILDGPQDPDQLKLLQAKVADPGAGMLFAAIAEVIYLLDAYGLPAAKLHVQLMSIYHLANLLVYPLTYFMQANDASVCEAFYTDWQEQYHTFDAMIRQDNTLNATSPPQVAIEENTPLPASFAEQQTNLRKHLPDAFNLLSVGFYLGQGLLGCAGSDLSGYAMAKQFLENRGGKFYQWYEGKDINFYDDFSNAMATILLTALLTKQASPVDAMGYKGPDKQALDEMAGKMFRVKVIYSQSLNQKDLLADHNAMLVPTKEAKKIDSYCFSRDFLRNHCLGS
ncbi:MAG TPA: hypothetical protein VI522_02335, partial [Gammaproteobacteria bacterium]|nr:hypothetical protein [Gammaproteobacteria bacterium]